MKQFLKRNEVILVCLLYFSSIITLSSWAAQQTIIDGMTFGASFGVSNANDTEQYAHMASTLNPHSVTKAQVGLTNAQDTADIDKSVADSLLLDGDSPSTAATADTIVLRDAGGDIYSVDSFSVETSISHAQAARTSDTIFYSGTGNAIKKNTATGIKTSLSIENLDNTSDANKPISTAMQTALDAKVNDTGTETIAGQKTFSTGITMGGNIAMGTNAITGASAVTASGDVQQSKAVVTEQATPATPASGFGALYGKTDGKVYYLNDAGSEVDLTASGGSTSPLTTKGDIYTFTTVDARVPVGANDTVMIADSAEAAGWRWGSVSGTGDVVGPASATTSVPAMFDGTTGKLLKNSTPTGTGNPVLATSPTLVTPDLGTPTALVATNASGTAASLTSGTVTTNANLTGPITSTGNATAVAAQTGTGTTFVMDTSPTLVTPVIGAATGTSLTLTGDLGATGSRVNHTYTTDLTVSNGITIDPSSNPTAYGEDSDAANGTFKIEGRSTGAYDIDVTISADIAGTATEFIEFSGVDENIKMAYPTVLQAGDIIASELASTAVTPGSYTFSSITVDQQGRITGAASGSPGAETNSLETVITGIADAEIFIGNGANSGTFAVTTGDVVMSNGGINTIQEDAVEIAMMANGDHGAFTYTTNVAALDANSVDSDQYVDGSIDLVHMSADSVDYTKTTGSFKATSLVGDPDSWTITTALHYGGFMVASAAGEDTLDAAVVGMSVSLSARDTIAAIYNPNASDTIIRNGVSLAQGEALISDDTAGTYSLATCVVVAANTWECSCSDGMTEETP